MQPTFSQLHLEVLHNPCFQNKWDVNARKVHVEEVQGMGGYPGTIIRLPHV